MHNIAWIWMSIWLFCYCVHCWIFVGWEIVLYHWLCRSVKNGVSPTFSCGHGYCVVFPSWNCCLKRSSFPRGVKSLRSKQPINYANSINLKVYWLVHNTLQQVPILIQISSVHLQLQLDPRGCHFWRTHFPCILLALPISLSLDHRHNVWRRVEVLKLIFSILLSLPPP